MARFILRLLVIAGAFFIWNSGAYGQWWEPVGIGYLPENSYLDTRAVAIALTRNLLPKIVWATHEYPDPYHIIYSHLDTTGFQWLPREIDVTWSNRFSIWTGNDGGAFITTGNGSMFIEDGGSFREQSLSRSAAMDSVSCFHTIWRSNLGLYYGLSRDTMRTISDTISIPQGDSVFYIEATPDRGLVAVMTITGDTIYKYIANAGSPIDPDSSISFVFSRSYKEISLDNNGHLFMLYLIPGSGEYWYYLYAWSEEFGSRFLCPLGDIVLSGTFFELAFNPSRNMVLIMASNTFPYNFTSTGFMFSTDTGDTWSRSNITLQGGNATCPRLFGDILYLVNEDFNALDIYVRSVAIDSIINNAVSIVEQPSIPSDIFLSNYPNPFNAQTTITFNLPIAGQVALSIYDIAGREIKTLLNEIQGAGSHSIIWNGMNEDNEPVSSGIYFCKLEIDGRQSSIGKMLLLK